MLLKPDAIILPEFIKFIKIYINKTSMGTYNILNQENNSRNIV